VEGLDRDGLSRLRHLLMSHPGECRAVLHLVVAEKVEAVIGLSPKLQVNPTAAFFQDMDQHFGHNCAEAVYKSCYA
jgi:DNA polymerase-3 subunit alpha